jgi:hypothetical protein
VDSRGGLGGAVAHRAFCSSVADGCLYFPEAGSRVDEARRRFRLHHPGRPRRGPPAEGRSYGSVSTARRGCGLCALRLDEPRRPSVVRHITGVPLDILDTNGGGHRVSPSTLPRRRTRAGSPVDYCELRVARAVADLRSRQPLSPLRGLLWRARRVDVRLLPVEVGEGACRQRIRRPGRGGAAGLGAGGARRGPRPVRHSVESRLGHLVLRTTDAGARCSSEQAP